MALPQSSRRRAVAVAALVVALGATLLAVQHSPGPGLDAAPGAPAATASVDRPAPDSAVGSVRGVEIAPGAAAPVTALPVASVTESPMPPTTTPGTPTPRTPPGAAPPTARSAPADPPTPQPPFDEGAARAALTPVDGVVGSPGGDVPAPPAPPVAPRIEPVTGTYLELPDEDGLNPDTHTDEEEPPAAVVRADDGTLAAVEADPGLDVGDRVEVAVDGTTTLVAAEPTSRTLAEVGSPTTRHTVRVVGLVPAGGATPELPSTRSAGVDLVNGRVNDFWSSQTDRQVSFGVVSNQGWLRARSGCDNPAGLFNEGLATVGGALGRDEHLVILLPRNSWAFGCSYGLGTIGGLDAGGYLYATAGDWTVLAHELGHNLGLNHSDGTVCDTRAAAVIERGCESRPYFSDADIMGSSGPTKPISSLASAQLSTLGVGASVLGIAASTVVRLTPLAGRAGQGFTNGYTAATVTERDGTRYFVEYRSRAGRDATVGRRRDGVLVWRSSPVTRGGFAELRDNSFAMDLQPGQSFTSASGATRVRVLELGAAARVAVEVGGAPAREPAFAPMALGVPTPTSSPGVYQLSGRAWAQDGVVRWSVREVGGSRRLNGTANTQRGDQSAPWSTRVSVPPGNWRVEASVANPGATASTGSNQLARVTLTAR